MTEPKTRLSLRIDDDLLRAVEDYAQARDTTKSAAALELIRRGLADPKPVEEQAPTGQPADDGPLLALVETLKSEVDMLTRQLDIKDGQISALTMITSQAQALHAQGNMLQAGKDDSDEGEAVEVQTEPTAETTTEKRSFWARVFG